MGAAFDAMVDAVAAARPAAPASPPALATSRRGREVVARREYVEAYDQARMRPQTTREGAAGEQVAALERSLRKAGLLGDDGMTKLTLRPKRRRRP